MAYERDFPPLAAPEPRWRERLRQYWALVRGDRPIGWLLLLWPTWWGLWLAAKGVPPIWPLIVFSLGVWLTRSAGCVINDYADPALQPLPPWRQRLALYWKLVRGDRPIGWLLLLWPTWW